MFIFYFIFFRWFETSSIHTESYQSMRCFIQILKTVLRLTYGMCLENILSLFFFTFNKHTHEHLYSITNILFFRSWCNDTCWVLVNFFMIFLGIYFEADFFLDFFLSYHSSPFYVCFAMIYLFVLQPTPLNFVKKVFIVSFCAHFYHSLKYLQLGVRDSVLKCEDKFEWVCQLNGIVMFLILKLSLKAFIIFSWYVIKLN